MGKIQVRNGLFETNSSSVHSLVMCSDSDFEKWKNGELVFDRGGDKLVSIDDPEYLKWKEDFEKHQTEDPDYYDDYCYRDYLSYEDFNDYDILEYETFEQSYETDGGETVKAFGYYGHD